MPTYDACLLDVFETVLTVDQLQHGTRLAERAGAPAEAFVAAVERWGPRVNAGAMTLGRALEAVLRDCGVAPTDGLVEALVAADLELVTELAVVPDDTRPFLQALRAAGIRTAFVSNCNPNARALLDTLGLADLVDELVLSCEVGAAKPDRRIYEVALDRLGVAAERAVLVDDQPSYCAGAREVGIAAIRIDRADGGGDVDTLAAVTGRVLGPT